MIFSIIVPHYNLGFRIKNLFSSLSDELDDSFEIILVDDKSQKKYIEEVHTIINEFKELNIKFYQNNTSEKGAGVCRNIGMQKATGEWYIFSDSDDHFLPGFKNVLLKYINSDADIVYFPPTSTGKYEEKARRHETFLQGFDIFNSNNNDVILKYKFPVVWSKLFRASFIKSYSISFDNTIASNDVIFSLKSSHYAKKFLVSDNTIYSWDYQADSITSNMSKQKFEDIIDVQIRRNDFLKKNLDKESFDLVKESAIKPFVMSLLRYRLGISYSFSMLIKLYNSNVPMVSRKELNVNIVKRFFENNKFYK